MIPLILLVLAVVVPIIYGYWHRAVKRKRLRSSAFASSWQQILEQHVPLYRHLPPDLRDQLHRHINVFMAEKQFEGCGGLTMTDHIRLTIASQACLLLLNRDAVTYFPGLTNILVYPSAYVVPKTQRLRGGLELVGKEVRAGESWGNQGILVLSWDSVLTGTLQLGNGHNVVLHEFAHQLDHEDGAWDGTPLLEHRQDYDAWSKYLGEAYVDLQHQVKAGKHTVIDPYGATNEAEFFAVLTEHFFDIPWVLKKHYPQLYQELQRYYHVDPAAWFSERFRASF